MVVSFSDFRFRYPDLPMSTTFFHYSKNLLEVERFPRVAATKVFGKLGVFNPEDAPTIGSHGKKREEVSVKEMVSKRNEKGLKPKKTGIHFNQN